MRVSYTGSNGCPALHYTELVVTIHPRPAPAITGESVVCTTLAGLVYSTEPGMSDYSWTITGGGNFTGNTSGNVVGVKWNNTGTQAVSVNYSDIHGCRSASPSTFNVQVNPPPVPLVSGPVNACTSVNAVYSTEAGMVNYAWTISPGGTVIAGGTTLSSSVTISWTSTGSRWVKVGYSTPTGCQSLTPTMLNINVNAPTTPVISGGLTACFNTPTVFATQTGMSNYTWSVSPDGTIVSGGGATSSYISISWNTYGPKTISLNFTNGSGCPAATPTLKTITIVPLPVPAITGPANVCKGSSGNQYVTEPGMTNYAWSISSGGTINGSATGNTINVTWNSAGSQYVKVNYSNSNTCRASTPAILTVNVDQLPAAAATVSGPSQVLQGQPAVSYSIPAIANATGYVWELPSGAVIVSGQNSPAITVDFTSSVAAGYIVVHGTSNCGSGSSSQPLLVNLIPASAVVQGTVVTGSQAVCYHASQTITVAGNGTTFTIENGGSATMTAGQKISLLPGVTVFQGGAIHCYITSTGQYCTSVPSLPGLGPVTKTSVTGVGDGVYDQSVRLFPNPTGGEFTIVCNGSPAGLMTGIEIYSSGGICLYRDEFPVTDTYKGSLAQLPPGLYMVNIKTTTTRKVLKIIKF